MVDGGRTEWQISVPIFRNSVILKQLGLAVGIPFGLMIVILIFVSGFSIYILYILGLLGVLFLSTWLFIMAVYKGKYDAEFIIDSNGVLCRTQSKQAKRNKIINGLTFWGGLFSGRPATSGAGMLASSRQSVFLKWSCIKTVKYKPRQKTILLRGGWTESIALFCKEENYLEIEQIVKTRSVKYKK